MLKKACQMLLGLGVAAFVSSYIIAAAAPYESYEQIILDSNKGTGLPEQEYPNLVIRFISLKNTTPCEMLDIDGNAIIRERKLDFSNYQALIELDLSGCSFNPSQSCSYTSLNNLSHSPLKKLVLKSCHIDEALLASFFFPQHLKSLDLSCNLLQDVTKKSLSLPLTLTSLSLSACHLKTLPNIEYLYELKRLDISNNPCLWRNKERLATSEALESLLAALPSLKITFGALPPDIIALLPSCLRDIAEQEQNQAMALFPVHLPTTPPRANNWFTSPSSAFRTWAAVPRKLVFES